ncbi:MAG: ABC transporter permease [SAR202 cluster bacterium]|jgi:peptide/nickel transport system permease protein|nr:ABC transporter permease [SAR202 cluster bacterium]
MIGYISRRLVLAAFTVVMISMLAFFIIELPEGDLASKRFQRTMFQSGNSEAMADEIIAELRLYLGLDKPIYVRYGKWIWRMVRHGDLGRSYGSPAGGLVNLERVTSVIGDRLWLTVALTGFTILFTWTFAIPIGIYSAIRQHSVGDYVFTFMGFTGLAVPDFLLGLVLMYVAFAYFDQNVGGLLSADYTNVPWSLAKVYDLIKHLWIPAVVLGTSGTAGLIRIMRNNLLDELTKPYVVTARARGVHPVKVIIKYPLRVAINPLISTIGYLLPSLVSGSVIVSVVLSLPTIGPVLLTAITDEDVYLAGFIVLTLGMLTVVGTLISDILLAVVDPRIRFTE